MENLKFNRHYLFLFWLYLFTASQIYDISMYIWSKAVIEKQGFFEVNTFVIAVCALIGTTAGYMMVKQVFKGIDMEIGAAMDWMLEYMEKMLVKEKKGEGKHE